MSRSTFFRAVLRAISRKLVKRYDGYFKRGECVCQMIGLKKEDTLKIHIAAHLHDIGKIGVPDSVLNKEGKLTDEEFAYIKKHPIIGAEILGKSHKLSEMSDIVLMHHERFDGKGYPIGKVGGDNECD